ncbi:hypothetical protein MASR1M46_16010 [Bacteroidales bacterium]
MGLFLGPLGIIIGPSLAPLPANYFSGTPGDKAFRSAIGSFIGFLLGVGLKAVVTFVIAFYFFKIWLF